MGNVFASLFKNLFGKKEMRILMVRMPADCPRYRPWCNEVKVALLHGFEHISANIFCKLTVITQVTVAGQWFISMSRKMDWRTYSYVVATSRLKYTFIFIHIHSYSFIHSFIHSFTNQRRWQSHSQIVRKNKAPKSSKFKLFFF